MNGMTGRHTGYYAENACDLETFKALIGRSTDPGTVQQATEIIHNVPIYSASKIADDLADDAGRFTLMAEWAEVFLSGPGALVIRNAQPDHEAIDAATTCYNQIIETERADQGKGADHFAAAGSNDRIWNSLQKLCLAAPDTYVRYFASPAIDAACEAWLGPNYQLTAQINVVHPGGSAQQAHRDYHLGFQTADVAARYPGHVHDLSPLLTLQGGIAHGDTPVESGPTKLLPFSQAYGPGYIAWRRDDFRAVFEERCIQVPLEKGDAIFFNPALFHAAGENRSKDIRRMVNLLQISSPFGRAMELLDRAAMCRAVLRPLKSLAARKSHAEVAAVIAATAEGYSFPTNLDRDPPVGGLAPATQADLLRSAVSEGQSPEDFAAAMAVLADRQRP